MLRTNMARRVRGPSTILCRNNLLMPGFRFCPTPQKEKERERCFADLSPVPPCALMQLLMRLANALEFSRFQLGGRTIFAVKMRK